MVDSKIFILSSHSENFGMSVVEAIACGLPVIISNNVAIFDEIRKNDAGIVTENNPEDIAYNVKILLENEELRKKLSRNALNLIYKNYDINEVSKKFIGILSSL